MFFVGIWLANFSRTGVGDGVKIQHSGAYIRQFKTLHASEEFSPRLFGIHIKQLRTLHASEEFFQGGRKSLYTSESWTVVRLRYERPAFTALQVGETTIKDDVLKVWSFGGAGLRHPQFGGEDSMLYLSSFRQLLGDSTALFASHQ